MLFLVAAVVALVGAHGLLASLHRFTFDMFRELGRTCLIELVVVVCLVVVRFVVL